MAEAIEGNCRRPVGSAAEWTIVAVLAAIAAFLAVELAFSPSPAGAQTGSAGPPRAAGGVFAVAGQVTRDSYGLYLVDLRNDTICLYEYVGGDRRLWLRAARTFEYDRQLDSYNTEPVPAKIADLVSQARRLKEVEKTPKP